jgi:hypothetical protein
MGYGNTTVAGFTPCLPCIAGIYDIVYKIIEKFISELWLDSIGDIDLLGGSGDDGSSTLTTCRLHTEGFSKMKLNLRKLVITKVWQSQCALIKKQILCLIHHQRS